MDTLDFVLLVTLIISLSLLFYYYYNCNECDTTVIAMVTNNFNDIILELTNNTLVIYIDGILSLVLMNIY